MEHNRFEGSAVPFVRRWHVIQEIDLACLIGAHHRRIVLCDRLEEIADALPAFPPEDYLRMLGDCLLGVAAEECDELPYLRSMLIHGPSDDLTLALLDHIRVRHAADAAMAVELAGALDPVAADDRRPSVDTLGYMLRGFFTGCRRAIDFEQLTIVALAERRLTPDARAMLVQRLSTSPLA